MSALLVFALPLCSLARLFFVAAQYDDAFRPDGDESAMLDKASSSQYRSLRDYANIRYAGHFPAGSFYSHGYGHEMADEPQPVPPHHVKTVIVTRQIVHPYHIDEKKLPVKMAADKPYAFVKPYSLPDNKAMGYPIRVYLSQAPPYDKPTPSKLEKLPIYIPKPYSKEKFFGQQLVDKQAVATSPWKLLDRTPFAVGMAAVDKKTPLSYAMEKPMVPYPIYVPHERLIPVPVQIEKPYPVERMVPYPVPVPIRIPVEIPVPVPMTRPEPIYIPIQERPQETAEQLGAQSDQSVPTFAVPQFFVPSAMLQHILQESAQNATTTGQPDADITSAAPDSGDRQDGESSSRDTKAETATAEPTISTSASSQPQTEESSTSAKTR